MGTRQKVSGRLTVSRSSPNAWRAIWANLERQISTASGASRFRALTNCTPALSRFHDSAALVSFLARRDADLDTVDRVYAALVELVQARGDAAQHAAALIWIGLRPALDGIYRWRLRVLETPDAAASEVAHAFAEVLDRADVGRINRLVCTLVRNTKRDLVDAYRRARAIDATPTALIDSMADPRVNALAPRIFLDGPRACADHELHMLRTRLQLHVGNNADVVLGAAVLEASHREMASHLGIPYQGIRKRYSAALRRLRHHVEGRPQRPLPKRPPGLRVAG